MDITRLEEFQEVIDCLETGDLNKWEETLEHLGRRGLTCQDDSAEILGHLYEYGKGVEQNLKEALAWYYRDKWFYKSDIERCLDKILAIEPEYVFKETTLPNSYLHAYDKWFMELQMSKPLAEKPQKVGDLFLLGKYPQTPDGRELPILWRVLAIEDNRMLIISEYCLDWLPYDGNYLDFVESFPMVALGQPEGTKSEIFSLSNKEIEGYMPTEVDRRATATPYVVSKGAYLVHKEKYEEIQDLDVMDYAVCWWTGSKAFTPDYHADVMPDGWICDSGDAREDAGGVRPAMWIPLKWD